MEHFEASEGALVVRDGRAFRVPTIVPAQRAGGRCVFLDEAERCTIHPAAPFGCRMFRVCTEEEGEDERSAAGLQSICESLDYQLTWSWLRTKGKIARPLGRSAEMRVWPLYPPCLEFDSRRRQARHRPIFVPLGR